MNSLTRVIVVDDDAPVRRALARLLTMAGYAVSTCSSGTDCLEMLRTVHFDCVILDLQMPLMSGFEVLSRLRGLGLHTTVVVMTGFDSPESRKRAASLGVTSYLTKPVARRTLLAAMRAAMAAHPPPLADS